MLKRRPKEPGREKSKTQIAWPSPRWLAVRTVLRRVGGVAGGQENPWAAKYVRDRYGLGLEDGAKRSVTIPTFSDLFPGTGEFFAAKRPATRVVRLGAARVHLDQVESAPPYRLRLPKPLRG